MKSTTGQEIANEHNTLEIKRSKSQYSVEIDYLMDEIKKLENKKYKEI